MNKEVSWNPSCRKLSPAWLVCGLIIRMLIHKKQVGEALFIYNSLTFQVIIAAEIILCWVIISQRAGRQLSLSPD